MKITYWLSAERDLTGHLPREGELVEVAFESGKGEVVEMRGKVDAVVQRHDCTGTEVEITLKHS